MLEELQAQYLAKFPQRIQTLQEALQDHQAGGEGLTTLRHLAHGLRGSGASYGFPAISQAAGELEDAPLDQVAARVFDLVAVLESPRSFEARRTILLVSPDAGFTGQFASRLSDDRRKVRVVKTGREALRICQASPPVLVLLELLLPDVDGRRLLKALRGTAGMEGIPLLVVATRGNSRLREECFALGADHYFDKACDPSLLVSTVSATLERKSRRSSTGHMRIMSRLLSRRAFSDHYEQRLRSRQAGSGCLLLIALGQLPEQDREAVVQGVAGVILKDLRAADQLVRWGEAELLLWAKETFAPGARSLLERVGARVRAREISVGDQVYRVGIQGGIAAVDRLAPPLEELLKRARASLQQAQARVGVTAGSRDAKETRRVLLAEDDPEFAGLVKYVLGQSGLVVEHLSSGEGVLERGLVLQPTLFVLDVRLPGVDGFELVRRIRAHPVLRSTPIVLLTALGAEEDVVKGLELGADDYIIKPCSPKELLARVQRLLSLQRVQESEFQPGSMAGRFTRGSLVELVQMLANKSKSGTLAVSAEHLTGQLDFSEGLLVRILSSSGLHGIEAAHELLACEEGRFEFAPAGAQSPAGAQTPVIRVESLLLEAMRRRDEGQP